MNPKDDPTDIKTTTVSDEVITYRDRQPLTPRQKQILIICSIVFVAAMIGIAILIWRSRKSGEAETKEEPVVSVKVAKAEKEPIAAEVVAVGTIFPREKADVAAKISAQIKRMALLKNQVVKAGQVIAVLESRDLQAQRAEAVAALRQELASQRSTVTGTIPQTNAEDEKALRDARAKLANARAVYERRQALYEKGGISKKDLEASQLDVTTAANELRLAEQTANLRVRALNPNDVALANAKVQAAQQRVSTLDAQLSYATIRAPITGIVTDQYQYEGEFASSGGKLVTISDISEVIVKAPFSDSVASQLKVGDPAAVLPTDTSAEELHGRVTLLSRSTDPTSRTVEVWVTLGNSDGRLRANGAAQITVSANSKSEAIVVPVDAVTLTASNGTEGTIVTVDAASKAHVVNVVTGLRTKNKIEITSGLQGGETIVIEGNFSLSDGTKVSVEKAEEEEKEEKK